MRKNSCSVIIHKTVIVIIAFIFISYTTSSQDLSRFSSPFLEKYIECRGHLLEPSFLELQKDLESDAILRNNMYDVLCAKDLLQLYYFLRVNPDSIRYYFDDMKYLAIELSENEIYYTAWSRLLSNNIIKGRTGQAINGVYHMREEALVNNVSFGLASSNKILGEIFYYMGLFDESVTRLNESLVIFQEINSDPIMECSIYKYLLLCKLNMSSYQEVFSLADSLDKICDINENNALLLEYKLAGLCSRSIAHSNLGELDKAIELLEEAKIHLEKLSDNIDCYLFAEPLFYEAKATLLDKSGNIEEAINAYDSAAIYFSCFGLTNEMISSSRSKAVLLEKAGEIQRAYENLKYYTDIRDSLNSEEIFQQLNELSTSFYIEDFQMANKSLENEVEKSRKRVYFVFIFALIIFVFLISFISLLQLRQNNQLKLSELKLIREKRALIDSEKKLTKALGKANESDRLKTSFLANISHEIRTPLNAIIGFSDILVKETDIEKRQQYIDIIGSNSELLLKLINDILDLSKIESGTLEHKYEEFDLVYYFRNIGMTYSELVKDTSVKIIVDVPDNIFMVTLDKQCVTQIITNLLTNAIKFTNEGIITIGFVHINKGIKLFVSDTGIGIPESLRSRILDRFYKVNVFSQGIGLGIPIARALVASLGGEFNFESEEGKGSTFWAWIPAH